MIACNLSRRSLTRVWRVSSHACTLTHNSYCVQRTHPTVSLREVVDVESTLSWSSKLPNDELVNGQFPVESARSAAVREENSDAKFAWERAQLFKQFSWIPAVLIAAGRVMFYICSREPSGPLLRKVLVSALQLATAWALAAAAAGVHLARTKCLFRLHINDHAALREWSQLPSRSLKAAMLKVRTSVGQNEYLQGVIGKVKVLTPEGKGFKSQKAMARGQWEQGLSWPMPIPFPHLYPIRACLTLPPHV